MAGPLQRRRSFVAKVWVHCCPCVIVLQADFASRLTETPRSYVPIVCVNKNTRRNAQLFRITNATLSIELPRETQRNKRATSTLPESDIVRTCIIKLVLALRFRKSTGTDGPWPDGPPTRAVMTSETNTLQPLQNDTAPNEAALRFLQLSARLLLEYNVRSKTLERRIERIARHLGVNLQTIVGYREVTLAIADGRGLHVRVPELRINVAVSAGALHVIDELCLDRIGLDEATKSLEGLERLAPRHGRWVVAVLFGLAASAIAWLLRADWGAIVVSGASSSVGLIARQELAKRSVILFAHPFAAGLIGAALGGLAIHLGWTETPGFCLIVPALMLVPGPHLINGVRDMLENHIQTGLCRLGLAAAIPIATALGDFGNARSSGATRSGGARAGGMRAGGGRRW
jgi:uncharacterized membrane protein YjjP (DUF1212 family)